MALVIIVDPATGRPKRRRRTKRQMAEARKADEIAGLMAGLVEAAKERLKSATPGQKGAATRIIRKALATGRGYVPKRGI